MWETGLDKTLEHAKDWVSEGFPRTPQPFMTGSVVG